MNRIRATLLALTIVTVTICNVSIAGTVTGTIGDIIVRQSDGLTYFFVVGGTATGKPACATGSYWIIQDENSEAGKKLYSMLLAAKLSSSTVEITGSNVCTRWSNGEDVLGITIK